MCLAFLLSSGLGAVVVVGMYLELSHVSLPFLFIVVSLSLEGLPEHRGQFEWRCGQQRREALSRFSAHFLGVNASQKYAVFLAS
jgi:hypothetical protein